MGEGEEVSPEDVKRHILFMVKNSYGLSRYEKAKWAWSDPMAFINGVALSSPESEHVSMEYQRVDKHSEHSVYVTKVSFKAPIDVVQVSKNHFKIHMAFPQDYVIARHTNALGATISPVDTINNLEADASSIFNGIAEKIKSEECLSLLHDGNEGRFFSTYKDAVVAANYLKRGKCETKEATDIRKSIECHLAFKVFPGLDPQEEDPDYRGVDVSIDIYPREQGSEVIYKHNFDLGNRYEACLSSSQSSYSIKDTLRGIVNSQQ